MSNRIVKVTITVYRGRPSVGSPTGQWRWRMQAANRKIVGASSEAFVRLSRCLENLVHVTGITIWSDDYDKPFTDKNRFLVKIHGDRTIPKAVTVERL